MSASEQHNYTDGLMDTIAYSQQPEVKLIKFNTLPVDIPCVTLEVNEEKCTQDQAEHFDNNLNKFSVNGLVSRVNGCSNTNNRKWPWTMPDDAKMSDTSSALSPEQFTRNTNEQFQVVWRQLTFGVSPSTYERFFTRAQSLWRLISKSKQRSPVDLDNHFNSHDNFNAANKKRIIFKNLNGHINSGEITAILGPSGAGKTSLLNAICSRVSDNYCGSVQLIGGGERRMRLSTIPQRDYLIENLTVRENLQYSSRLLNTDKNFDHDANILRVVKMLTLAHCYHSSVGNISGGEYKRVSIAQELLRQPDILILDEPTSGLDSLNCKKLIKSLAQLIDASRRGTINPMAIVVTIHQPDVDIFHMFDHVYCMARGGHVVFDGHPSDVMNVVRAHAGFYPDKLPEEMSQTSNPANLLIEIASGELYGQEPIERLAFFQRRQFKLNLACGNDASISPMLLSGGKTIDNGNNQFARSKQMISISSVLNSHLSLSPMVSPTLSCKSSQSSFSSLKEGRFVRNKRLNAKNDHRGHFWHHSFLLASRVFNATIKDSQLTLISLAFYLSIPFAMWIVYPASIGSVKACPLIQREMDMVSLLSNNTMSKLEKLQEEFSLSLDCSTMFFLSVYAFSMCSLMVSALAFPLNMHVLLKEVRNGWYNLSSFVVARTIADFPFEVLFPAISIAMIYVLLGMPSSYLEWRLWAIALVMAIVSMVSHTQGLIFGALFMDSVQSAIFLGSATTLPLMMLSGYTARIHLLPIFLQKLSWLSIYHYSTDLVNMIRFGFGICPCDNSTNEYLRTKVPAFSDLPARVQPLFSYYLTNSESENNTEPAVDVGDDINENNSTILVEAANSTMSFVADNTTAAISFVADLIPGISYDLTLNSTARSNLISKIESDEVDMFGQMANLMARSFSYGREITSCDSVRAQLLVATRVPKDEYLPLLFGGMFALLVMAKLILFVVVKYKIGSRI